MTRAIEFSGRSTMRVDNWRGATATFSPAQRGSAWNRAAEGVEHVTWHDLRIRRLACCGAEDHVMHGTGSCHVCQADVCDACGNPEGDGETFLGGDTAVYVAYTCEECLHAEDVA